MTNRSRLDFFIVSESVLYKTVNSTIPHSLSSTVFDHKPIFMSTKRKKVLHKQQINDSTLDDPNLTYYVRISVFESYVQHAVLDHMLNIERKNDILNEIGRVSELLHRLRILISDNIGPDVNNLIEMEIGGLRAEIREAFEDLPDLNFFESLNLGCERSVFF